MLSIIHPHDMLWEIGAVFSTVYGWTSGRNNLNCQKLPVSVVRQA